VWSCPRTAIRPEAGDIAQINELEFFPDTVDNYELGAKTTWLDGALIVNGALYLMDWKDPQVATASVNASLPITVNAGAAQTKGLELDFNYNPTSNFNLRGNYSFVDAKLTEDAASLIRTITPPGFGTAFEDGVDGDRLPGSPKHQFSVFSSYTFDLASGNEVELSGGYSWQDKVLSLTGGRGNSFTLPSYGRADVNATYRTDNWSLTAYVNNLFDDFSESSVTGTVLRNQIVSGASVRDFRTNVLPPRSYGLRMRYNFN